MEKKATIKNETKLVGGPEKAARRIAAAEGTGRAKLTAAGKHRATALALLQAAGDQDGRMGVNIGHSRGGL